MRAAIRTGVCCAGALLILLSACAPRPVHLQEPDWPRLSSGCYALLHLEIQLWSDRDDRLLPDPQLSRSVARQFHQDLSDRLPGLSPVPVAPAVRPAVDQHLALYDRVAAQALANQSSPRFADRRGRPDVSLGPGLEALHGCPILLVLQGYQTPEAVDGHSPQISLGAIEARTGRLVRLSLVRLVPGDDLGDAADRDRLLEQLLLGFGA